MYLHKMSDTNLGIVISGTSCHGGSFSDATSYEYIYKYCHKMIETWMTSMPIMETKFCVFCILTICNEILSWVTKVWMKSYLVSDNDCN